MLRVKWWQRPDLLDSHSTYSWEMCSNMKHCSETQTNNLQLLDKCTTAAGRQNISHLFLEHAFVLASRMVRRTDIPTRAFAAIRCHVSGLVHNQSRCRVAWCDCPWTQTAATCWPAVLWWFLCSLHLNWSPKCSSGCRKKDSGLDITYCCLSSCSVFIPTAAERRLHGRVCPHTRYLRGGGGRLRSSQ